MTKEEYLSQAAVLGRQIAKLETNIGFYRELSCSPSSSSNDEPRVSRSRSTDAPCTKMVHKVLELEEKVEKLKEQRDNLQAEITSVIEELSNEDYKALLILRYLQDLEWGMVCAKLSIAKTTAMRWHREAISKIVVPE